MDDILKNIKKYGNKKNRYKPFNNAVCYPLHSQDFVRTGFLTISPTIASRDYKDPKCIIEQKGILTNGVLEIKQNMDNKPIIYDDYNSRILKNQDVIGTITSTIGHSALRNGLKLMEKVKIKQATEKGYIECKVGGVADLSYPDSKTRRGRVQNEGNISPTLTAQGVDGLHIIESLYRIRKLTPLECWRLMGFNDDEFKRAEKVNSNTQLYKQAGNSIVVDVLQYIFKEIFEPTEKRGQLTIFDLDIF